MTRISHGTLKIGLDNIQKSLDELKPEIKANTKFRIQGRLLLGILSLAAGSLGSGITLLIFLWPK